MNPYYSFGYDPYGMGGYGAYPGYPPTMPYDYGYGMGREPTVFDTIGGLIKSGAAANYNLKGMNLGPMRDIASQINALSNAQYDPSDPLYQRVYEAERGAGMQDLSASIAEASRQNRKLSASGRTPLFDPERGGELAFRTMARGYQDVQSEARQRARQILAGGQAAKTGAYGAYGTLAQSQDANKKKKAFGIGNIAGMLPLLGRAF